MVNEVLDIDGNVWCIIPYNACLGSPTTRVGFGKTIAEAKADYGIDISSSVQGALPDYAEPLLYDGFSGIVLRENNLTYVGYKYGERLMRVCFITGKDYNYQDVPRDVFQKMLISESKGAFLAQNVKGHYRYYCVDGMTYEQVEKASKKSIASKINIDLREAFEAAYSSGDVISDVMSLARRDDGEYEQSLARLCFKWFCIGRSSSTPYLTMLDSPEMVERFISALYYYKGFSPDIGREEIKAALAEIKKAMG